MIGADEENCGLSPTMFMSSSVVDDVFTFWWQKSHGTWGSLQTCVCAQSRLFLLLAAFPDPVTTGFLAHVLASFPYCPVSIFLFVCLLCSSCLCPSTLHACASIASSYFLSSSVEIFHTFLHLKSTPVPYLIWQTHPFFLIVGKCCRLNSNVFYLSFCTVEEMEEKKYKWLHLAALSRKQTPLSVPLK